MKLDTVIVESLNIIRTKTPPKTFEVAPRNHHSLSYRLEGENDICFEDKVISSGACSITFVPVNTPYIHHINTNSEQIVAHFTTKNDIGSDIESFISPLHHEIELQFRSLYKMWELEQKESNLQCMAAFYNILTSIANNTNPSDNSKENRLLNDSIAYMHTHYRENDFSIEKLYKLSFISPAYYRRLFAKIYNCSPAKYLKKLRIYHAKQLLKAGYHTISEVAELSGFSSSTYFSYEFKKFTGCTPSQYKDL